MHYFSGNGKGEFAHLVSELLLCLFLLLLDLDFCIVHDLLSLNLGSLTGLLDDLRLHFVGIAEDVGLLTARLIEISLGFLTGIIELFFGVLRVFNTLVDEFGPAVDGFQDDGPSEFPEYQKSTPNATNIQKIKPKSGVNSSIYKD